MKAPAVVNQNQLTRYDDFTTDVAVAAGTTASIRAVAARAGYTGYVRRITASLFLSSASTVSIKDSSSSPKQIGVVPASQAAGSVVVLDAWEKGVALQEGQGLDLVFSAGAPPGIFYIEGYYFPSAVQTA